MATIVGYHALQSRQEIAIRNIFSFGAAVPQSRLVEGIVDNMEGKVESLYLFYTRQDSILKYWFRMVEWREAVGYSGLAQYQQYESHCPEVTLINCDEVVQHHTGYWRSKIVFECIRDILSGKDYSSSHKLLSGLHRMRDRFY